ncbi:MAG: hypothetical protein MUO54_02245, partial [Anaerolineales bacterium]|nr:hypothetical protein [Anaerolineales bacterium]
WKAWMKSIDKMSQAELAAYVDQHLKDSGLYVVLSGGAAVGIYSNGEYVSGDRRKYFNHSPRR